MICLDAMLHWLYDPGMVWCQTAIGTWLLRATVAKANRTSLQQALQPHQPAATQLLQPLPEVLNTTVKWKGMKQWERQLYANEWKNAKMARVLVVMEVTACDKATADAAWDAVGGITNRSNDNMMEDMVVWAMGRTRQVQLKSSLEQQCKTGGLTESRGDDDPDDRQSGKEPAEQGESEQDTHHTLTHPTSQ